MITRIFTGVIIATLCAVTFQSCSLSDDNSQENYNKELLTFNNYIAELDTTNFKRISEGLYYYSYKEGTGDSAIYNYTKNENDYVLVKYTGKTLSGAVFVSTDSLIAQNKGGTPVSTFNGAIMMPVYTNINSSILYYPWPTGFASAILNMKEGGKANIYMTSYWAYYSSTVGEISPYTSLIYDIELVKVIKDPAAYDKNLRQTFLANYGKTLADSVTTGTGAYVIEQTAGSGSLPTSSSYITVKYTGKLIDGRTFVNSTSSTFQLSSSITTGWRTAFSNLKSGSKGIIVIPYYAAYGSVGAFRYSDYRLAVTPYTSIVYEYEITDISTSTSK
jgi:FKBP-type peptidyl-prolyl cis-trans isomerase FkpA